MKITQHLLITGQVQGVGFRFFTQKAAQRFGVTGWVRNLGDGRVEALLQAEEDALIKMIEKVKEGSAISRVEHVDVMLEDVKEIFDTFEIRK